MELLENKKIELSKEQFSQLINDNKELFYDMFLEFYNEIIEDKGMLVALNEIKEEDTIEADSDELEAIFNGKFVTEE